MALVVTLGVGCGGSGAGVDDRARLDACVLMGASTNDGCDAVGSAPAIKLGDLTIGAVKTRDVALYNGGAGAVAATVSAIALEGASANYAILKVFRLDGALNEVAVTLPYDLAVSHGSELRVRVAFTANVAVGAVAGAALRVTASHPTTSVAIPISGQVTGCPTGFGDCDGDVGNGCEVDLQTSSSDCGACGAICGSANATSSCSGGACQIACAAGFGNCDGDAANGCEADLLTDPAHCNACGTACDATNGTPACNAGACAIACAAGFGDCDADAANGCEADLSTDAGHCGACGTVCGSVNGAGTCSAGLCVTSCDPGFASCDGSAANGCEVTLGSDLANCGTCGHACSSVGGTAACSAGACQITCAAGAADCDGNVANGCEVTLATDPANCGTCGTTCNGTNGTATCSGSICGVTCSTGFANCDGSAANGCEVTLASDPANCGACGAVCSSVNGTPSCGSGACAIACVAGFASCDGSVANGCEVDLRSDLANCGACAHACGTAHATPACDVGVCRLACTSGYLDCNLQNADGCEVNALFDPANCGVCGNVCLAPNGAPACAAGGCMVAACNGGFADCNGVVADGCEVDLAGDANNCGGCNNVCTIANGSGACSGGACAVAACNPGWADCDGNPANGCEHDVTADPANCGTCGNVCPAVPNGTPACSAGACGLGACTAGWANCDGQAANGCEANLASDVGHCGACGNACNPANASTFSCNAGACVVTSCSPGYFDMNGQGSDGCECAGDGNASTCAVPAGGNVLSPGQVVGFSGNLAPLGKSEYVQVTFTGNTSFSYHPAISISSPGAFALFDVLAPGCGGAASGCGEGGTSVGRSFWEAFSAMDTNCTFSLGGCIWPALPGAAGTVVIRVYAAASTTTCGNYTLTVQN